MALLLPCAMAYSLTGGLGWKVTTAANAPISMQEAAVDVSRPAKGTKGTPDNVIVEAPTLNADQLIPMEPSGELEVREVIDTMMSAVRMSLSSVMRPP